MTTTDDDAFDFLPTPLEMLEQRCTLLSHELEETQREAAVCRQNLAKVVAIRDDLNADLECVREQLAHSQAEVRRLTSALSEANQTLVNRAASKLSEVSMPIHGSYPAPSVSMAGGEARRHVRQ